MNHLQTVMMSTKGSSDEELQLHDRLSDLPDCLIYFIMSFLPMGDAVRTSILSKRFRYCWKGTQVLKLDADFFRDFIEGKDHGYQDVYKSIFRQLIGPLQECALYIPLLDTNVEKDDNTTTQLNLPNAYIRSCLTKVSFEGCELKTPPSWCVYCNLVSLSLLTVKLEGDMLEAIICKAPKIRSLVLVDLCITGNNPLVLSAPELRMLEYRSSQFALKLSNLPSLDSATIHSKVELHSANSEKSPFQQFFSLVPKIKELNLGDTALSSLIDRKVPENVKKVPMDSVGLSKMLFCAMSLIRTSLNLKKLEFMIEEENLLTDINMEADLQFRESELLDEVEASYLKCLNSGEYNEVLATIREIMKTAITLRIRDKQ